MRFGQLHVKTSEGSYARIYIFQLLNLDQVTRHTIVRHYTRELPIQRTLQIVALNSRGTFRPRYVRANEHSFNEVIHWDINPNGNNMRAV